jgi:alkanesulfonate monooxygenase SsuD/methylene tetrahydromethanopterin reductase-like flavin-dependent oxidoreductase (luciferase family)
MFRTAIPPAPGRIVTVTPANEPASSPSIAELTMRIGLTLPNRAISFGVVTAEDLLRMAEIADRSDLFQSVWVGDSLLGKPRFDSTVLLSAIAARTQRVRIGVACMASFSLRDPVQLAQQWASLDLLANGRTVLTACTGIVEQAGGQVEGRLYNVRPKDRVSRMLEWIEILKRLWTADDVTFEGEHYRFSGISIQPKPAAKPRPPIWIANNAGRGTPLHQRTPEQAAFISRTNTRVATVADGWQTAVCDPEDVAWRIADIRDQAAKLGRDPSTIATHAYHNINLQADRSAALEESKRFLDTYYITDYPASYIDCWTAAGTAADCIAHLERFREIGIDEITLRMTSWDQFGQLRRVMDEVLPAFRD